MSSTLIAAEETGASLIGAAALWQRLVEAPSLYQQQVISEED